MSNEDALVMRTKSLSRNNELHQTDSVPEVVVINKDAWDGSHDFEGGRQVNGMASPDSDDVMIAKEANAVVVSNPNVVSEFQEKVSLSWEDVCVQAELPKPSLIKRCCKKDDVLKPQTKEILFDG